MRSRIKAWMWGFKSWSTFVRAKVPRIDLSILFESIKIGKEMQTRRKKWEKIADANASVVGRGVCCERWDGIRGRAGGLFRMVPAWRVLQHLVPHSNVDFLSRQFTISIGIMLHQPCIMFSFDLVIYHLHSESQTVKRFLGRGVGLGREDYSQCIGVVLWR